MSADLSPLFTWRSVVASEHGPPSSTRRHVLLTLSLHMNERGGSCFPSTRTLAQETGLSRKTVEKHLRTANEEGWIDRSVHGLSGQGWKRFEYGAEFPPGVLEELQEGGEARYPRLAEGGEAPSGGGEAPSEKVGNELRLRSSVEDDIEDVGAHAPRMRNGTDPDPPAFTLATCDCGESIPRYKDVCDDCAEAGVSP